MSEHDLQKTVAQFLALAMPADVPFTAIDHAAKLSPRQAGERRARGVIRGIPDWLFILPPDGQTAWIELKVEGGRLSPEQVWWRDCALNAGARYAVCRSLDDVCETLDDWGVVLKANVRAA